MMAHKLGLDTMDPCSDVDLPSDFDLPSDVDLPSEADLPSEVDMPSVGEDPEVPSDGLRDISLPDDVGEDPGDPWLDEDADLLPVPEVPAAPHTVPSPKVGRGQMVT